MWDWKLIFRFLSTAWFSHELFFENMKIYDEPIEADLSQLNLCKIELSAFHRNLSRLAVPRPWKMN